MKISGGYISRHASFHGVCLIPGPDGGVCANDAFAGSETQALLASLFHFSVYAPARATKCDGVRHFAPIASLISGANACGCPY
jgi:hypothetical protein